MALNTSDPTTPELSYRGVNNTGNLTQMVRTVSEMTFWNDTTDSVDVSTNATAMLNETFITNRENSSSSISLLKTSFESSQATSTLADHSQGQNTTALLDHLSTLSSSSSTSGVLSTTNTSLWVSDSTSATPLRTVFGSLTTPANVTESPHLLTVEEAEDAAAPKNEIKELVYVVIVIAFYSAALLALIVLQIRRYYTRNSSYTSFGDGSGEGYDLYEEYSENRQLIFEESRRQETERKVRNIQGVHNGYAIDSIPEHVV